jgi:hypothetical protein
MGWIKREFRIEIHTMSLPSRRNVCILWLNSSADSSFVNHSSSARTAGELRTWAAFELTNAFDCVFPADKCLNLLFVSSDKIILTDFSKKRSGLLSVVQNLSDWDLKKYSIHLTENSVCYKTLWVILNSRSKNYERDNLETTIPQVEIVIFSNFSAYISTQWWDDGNMSMHHITIYMS